MTLVSRWLYPSGILCNHCAQCCTPIVILRMAGGLALLLAAAGAFAEEYLRVDSPSDGRSYTIDLDQTSVRRAMHPVAKSTGTSKLPAWLLPAPNAQPSDVRYDPGTGMVQAIFMLNALETDVIAFYTEALRGA